MRVGKTIEEERGRGMMATDCDLHAQRQDLGTDIIRALQIANMSHKQAALLVGLDKGSWSKMVHGDLGLDLGRLLQLGWPFWSAFLPLLIARVVTQSMTETFADHQAAAALIRPKPTLVAGMR